MNVGEVKFYGKNPKELPALKTTLQDRFEFVIYFIFSFFKISVINLMFTIFFKLE